VTRLAEVVNVVWNVTKNATTGRVIITMGQALWTATAAGVTRLAKVVNVFAPKMLLPPRKRQRHSQNFTILTLVSSWPNASALLQGSH